MKPTNSGEDSNNGITETVIQNKSSCLSIEDKIDIQNSRNEMANLTMSNESSCKNTEKQKCQCCPYGFHINTDFVEYCNSIYQNSLEKKVCLSRHSKKMVGSISEFQSESSNSSSHLSSNKSQPSAPFPDLLPSSHSPSCPEKVSYSCPHCDSPAFLSVQRPKMIEEFEYTLNKMKSSACRPTTLHLSQRATPKNFTTLNTNGQSSPTYSQNGSTSSLSSVSTSCSINSATQSSELCLNRDGCQGMDLADCVSTGSNNSSILNFASLSPTSLANIREQMAKSLHRVRELEKKVKAIPLLQVKLSVLKEEKRLLLLQLKSKANGFNHRSVGVGDRSVHDTYSDISFDVKSKFSPIRNMQRTNSLTETRKHSYSSSDTLISPGLAAQLSSSLAYKDFDSSDANLCQDLVTDQIPSDHQNYMPCVSKRNSDVCYTPESKSSSDECIATSLTVPFKDVATQTIFTESDPLEDGHIMLYTNGSVEMQDVEQYKCNKSYNSYSQTCNLCQKKLQIKFVDSSAQTDISDCEQDCNHISSSRSFIVPYEGSVTSFLESVDFKSDLKTKQLIVGCDKNNYPNCSDETKTCTNIIESSSPRTAVKDIGVGDSDINDVICFNCKNKIHSEVDSSNLSSHSSNFEDVSQHPEICSYGSYNLFDNIIEIQRPVKIDGVDSDNEKVAFYWDTKLKTPFKILKSNNFTALGVTLCETCCESIQEAYKNDNLEISEPETIFIPTSANKFRSNYRNDDITEAGNVKTGVPRQKGIGTCEKPFHPYPFCNSNSSSSCSSSDHSSVPLSSFWTQKSPGNRIGGAELTSESDTSESRDSESSYSPEEGSYDGVLGCIVNSCADDEAIRQGLPGARMFQPSDNLSKIKLKLDSDLTSACNTVNRHLNNPGDCIENLESSMSTVQQEWFKITSFKGIDFRVIEAYLNSFEGISKSFADWVVNLSDVNGNTAMHFALSHNDFNLVSLLLNSEAADVNKRNNAGYTAIMLVCLAEINNETQRNIVQRLLQHGDVNVKAAQNGQTALMLAVSRGQLDIVKLLIEAGADINQQDDDGSTALMCAAEHGHITIAQQLLANCECDPSITDNDGSTACQIALEAGHTDVGLLIYFTLNGSRANSPYSSMRHQRLSSKASCSPSRLSPSRPTPPEKISLFREDLKSS